MKVGKAKYSTGKNTFYVKRDEPFVARILPALGKLADSGTWRMYYSVQWGFKNSAGRQKPFVDPFKKNFNNGMVEVDSAARNFREALTKKKDSLKEAANANPSNQQVVAEYEKYKKLVSDYNLDNNNHMNVVTLDGKVGVLKLGTKMKNALLAEIDKQLKNGVDPLDMDKGMYFEFYKTNPSPTKAIHEWVHSVVPYKEQVQAQVNGQTVLVEQYKYHTMDEAFLSRLDSEAFELSEMYPTPTAEEVERIVTGGPTAVDEILGADTNKTEGKSVSEASTTDVLASVENMQTVGHGALSGLSVETPVVTETVSMETSTVLPDTAGVVNTATVTTDDSPVPDSEFLAELGIKTQ